MRDWYGTDWERLTVCSISCLSSAYNFPRDKNEYPIAAKTLKAKEATLSIVSKLLFRWMLLRCSLVAALVCSLTSAIAENCQTSSDMDDGTRNGITAAGQRYFGMITKGDSGTLKQNAIPSLAGDFSGIEATVKEKQAGLANTSATVRSSFLLETDGTAPISRAEFFCGVFGKSGQTSGSAVFVLNNLPPAKYAVVILDASSAKAPSTVSLVLQQAGTDWKLGGLYIKSLKVAGHDGDWFAARAREYKTKGQLHNAWLYFLETRSLASPLPFMSTAASDKLYDESQGLQPSDVPADGKTVDLVAGTATYKLTALFPEAVGDDLDLIVKYQANDISNSNQTYQNNVAVVKALVAKYPEFRGAFAAVVARAVDPNGRDYGTLVAMKDIK